MRRFTLNLLLAPLACGIGCAYAAPLPVRLISAQIESVSAQTAEMTPDSNPVIVTGAADSASFALDEVIKSYDFGLCDAKTHADLGQSPSGYAYLVNGAASKERPSGPYQFVIRYWLDKNLKHELTLCMKRKPLSNSVKVQGTYAGTKF